MAAFYLDTQINFEKQEFSKIIRREKLFFVHHSVMRGICHFAYLIYVIYHPLQEILGIMILIG
jgi:hypothetical protein